MTRERSRSAADCPRCRGRLFAGQDRYGSYQSCLTCGFMGEVLGGGSLALVPPEAEGGSGSAKRRLRGPTRHGRPL
jgi:hypothetical protein